MKGPQRYILKADKRIFPLIAPEAILWRRVENEMISRVLFSGDRMGEMCTPATNHHGIRS
jgi:hypothetical protein